MSKSRLMTAPRIFLENAKKMAEKPRFQIKDSQGNWKPILWSEYAEKVEQTALWLRSVGVGLNQKVSIFSGTRVEWAYAGIATQCARGVLVPIYHSNTPPQTQYVLEHSDSIVCFTESVFLDHFQKFWDQIPNVKFIVVLDWEDVSQLNHAQFPNHGVDKQILAYGDVLKAGARLHDENNQAFELLVEEAEDEDPCSIIYTSGTTGMPKGVVLSNYNVVKNGEDWISVLGSLIPETRVDLLWLPLSHIFGWGEIGLGNSLGFETYFTNPKDVLPLLQSIKPTVFMSVPAYWEKLFLQAINSSSIETEQIEKLMEVTGGRLKFCLSGGAGLKKEVKDFYFKAGILLVEGYGLTEASPTITMNRPDDFNFESVGKPFPSVEVKLGEDGEILAKGPNIFVGYYKNPEATKDTMTEDGWLKTGDLGEWTSDGFLKIIGRKKDIIVTAGGKNISPQLIEAQFLDNQLIEHIVLYGNEHKYLVAMITLKQHETQKFAKQAGISTSNHSELCTEKAILDFVQKSLEQINQGLASYETIKKFFILPESLSIEKEFITPSLKIKRNVIHKAFREQFEALYK
ncbi:MAG: long-chain fatty acid--CoA ligase [Candidatus Cloacimonetes bacterium]|nr:long-chain fatty acid--CoA ligase [Candidatus Cloacimonadota bacterium]